MESLDILMARKRQAEYDLEKITIRRHGSTPWAGGVQDQHKSDSYSYNEYTEPGKAYRLIEQIKYLDDQIKNYAQRAQAEREAQERIRESRIPKYEYTQGGKTDMTKNSAMAARYNAQQRFFAMGKLKQTMAKLNGQYKKFKVLWNKASMATSQKEQQEVANELNGMFRR